MPIKNTLLLWCAGYYLSYIVSQLFHTVISEISLWIICLRVKGSLVCCSLVCSTISTMLHRTRKKIWVFHFHVAMFYGSVSEMPNYIGFRKCHLHLNFIYGSPRIFGQQWHSTVQEDIISWAENTSWWCKLHSSTRQSVSLLSITYQQL